jgi:hypothetical protein
MGIVYVEFYGKYIFTMKKYDSDNLGFKAKFQDNWWTTSVEFCIMEHYK